MTKLSESIIRHQENSVKKQQEKEDNRLKSWNKLPKIQQNILLLGGIEEDGTVPDHPTEEMLSILGWQNGAQVDQFLRQSMTGHNMSLETGFCSALNKGILVCPDDTQAPKNFSPFLTPPVRDNTEEEEKSNLLKLAIQEKFEQSDRALLTKMEVAIPLTTLDLRHHLKNFTGLVGRVLGQGSLAFLSLRAVVEHIDENEISYNFEFRHDKFFGGTFLDKINWRFHRFLDSCANGDHTKIKLQKLDFLDMTEGVESREFFGKTPVWITRLTKKQEQKYTTNENLGSGGGGGERRGGGSNGYERKRRQFEQGGGEPKKRIFNPQKNEACLLRSDERLRDIFHPGNVRNIPRPKLKNGNHICVRYQALGFCYHDCSSANGHKNLSPEETKDFLQFLKSAREARESHNKKGTVRQFTTNVHNNTQNTDKDKVPTQTNPGTTTQTV
jgi:hypothetical protein